MVRAGANKRKADSPIHSAALAEQLQWNKPLIVIHRHDEIKLAADGSSKERVGWERPADINTP